MHIRRRLLTTVGTLLLLIFALPGLAWLALPALAPSLAAHLLARHGIDLQELVIERPGLRGMRITRLALRQEASGLQLHADDVSIGFEALPAALQQPLASLIVGHLDLTLDPPPSTEPAASSTLPSLASPTVLPTVLPTALLSGLPVRRLEIETLTARGRIAEQRFEGSGRLSVNPRTAVFSGVFGTEALPGPLAIHAELQHDQQIRLRIDRSETEVPYLTLAGRLQPTADSAGFSGELHLNLDTVEAGFELHLALATTPSSSLTLAPPSQGKVAFRQGALKANVTLTLDEALTLGLDADGRLLASGTLPLLIEGQQDDLSLSADLKLSAFVLDTESQARVHVEGSGRARWPEGETAFDLRLPLGLHTTAAELTVATAAEVTLQRLQHAQTELDHLHLRSTAAFTLTAAGLRDAAELTLIIDDPSRMELSAALRITPDLDLLAEIEQASLPLADNDLLAIILPASAVPRSGRLDFSGDLRRTAAGLITTDGLLRWQNAGLDLPHARLRGSSGRASLDYRDGVLRLGSAESRVDRIEWISADGPESNVLLQGLAAEASGTLHIEFEGHPNDSPDPGEVRVGQLDLNTSLTLRRISQGEMTAHDLQLHSSLLGPARQPSLTGRLELGSAAVGVPLREVRCAFASEDLSAWQLSDCSASLLGGTVSLPQGDFDLTAGDGYLPLAVTGIELSAVLGLMQDPALDGRGTLDGSLPLRLQALQPSVEQGWLAVRPPGGVLSYLAPASTLAAVQQPALLLTLRAVRDLRYQRLETRVDYSEDGTLTLGVNLLGSNPDIEGGRPIQLNLNVTQNLLGLLKSLRLSEDIERELQRRLQRVQP